MNTWITSDWHLGEERMGIMGRPFSDAKECFEAMLDHHNGVVKPDDRVIVAGDVLYQKGDVSKWLPLIAKFNGRKVLVRGNHDRVLSDSDLAPYFEEVHPDGSRIEIEHGGVRYAVTHYPTQGSGDLFNLVGHIHGAWKVQLNMLNVCVDVHHFRPVNLDDIPFWTRAVKEFYDEDVWVAYWAANARWRGTRGKPGTYLEAAQNGGKS